MRALSGTPRGILWIAGSLAAWAACTTPSKEPQRASSVPAGELPASHRELLAAYGAGRATWEQERELLLADPALERFLVENLVIEMMRAFAASTGPDAERARSAFDRAQAELVRLPDASVPVLAGLLEIADEVTSVLAMQTLERIGRPALPAALQSCASPTPTARRRAAHLLGRLPPATAGEDAAGQALALLLARDPEWIVRAEAALSLGARAARDRATEPARKALEAGLEDPDPAVCRSSARALIDLGDPLAVPALIRSLEVAAREGEPRMVQACQAALRGLTGETRPLDFDGWRNWWLDHRDELRRSAAGR